MTEIKGYKAVTMFGLPKFGRRKTPYKENHTHKTSGKLELCHHGLHFCIELANVYRTYASTYWTRVFRVAALGQVRQDDYKSCTDKLRFGNEMSPDDIIEELARNGHDGHDNLAPAAIVGCMLRSMLATPRAALRRTDVPILVLSRLNRKLERRSLFIKACAERRTDDMMKRAIGMSLIPDDLLGKLFAEVN